MDAIIYTAYHKPAPRFASASVVPMHVGRARAANALADMIGDDTGDNISNRNAAYCELTALYWAWKNAPADKTHIGLMHYRRLLDITGRAERGFAEVTPPRLDIAPWLAEVDARLGTDSTDLIVPRLHVMGRSLAENYQRAHQSQDFEAARAIIATDHPAYLATFDRIAAQRAVRLGNMSLMRRDLFERYCDWLFDILFKVEAQALDRRHYTPKQGRYLGFLAERLFTIWVAHLEETDPTLKVREVAILNLERSLVVPYVDDDRFSDPTQINIALSADDAYLPHAAAMLRSLIDHVDTTRPLNVFMLHDDVDPQRLSGIAEVVSDHPRAGFHPLNAAGAFDGFYRSASRAPSNATYNRFLLFALLPKLSRLLYLDADMVVLRDIAPLFDTDMQGAALGAVPDWIMTRTLAGPTPTIDPKVPDLSTYQRDVLGLSEGQMGAYVNAGVLLFDFSALDDPAATGERLIEKARKGGYLFRDQDILNAHFAGRIKVLDARWNVFNTHDDAYGKVPAPNHAKAMAARAEPWIVHYADRGYKPWRGMQIPRAAHYWQALIRTPFFGEVTASLKPEGQGTTLGRMKDHLVEGARAAAARWPVLRGPLLRAYVLLGRSRN